MDLSKLRIFQSGLFKQAKFLFSAPTRAQKVFMISESGTLSLELLPLSTGYLADNDAKMAWNVIHKLKVGLTEEDDPVLPVSERSRIPLDPYNIFNEEDLEKLSSLKAIAATKYTEAFSHLVDKQVEGFNAKMVKIILYGIFIIFFLLVIILMIK